MNTPLLTLKEVAERLRYSDKWVRRLIATRKLRAQQIGKRGQYRIDPADLAKFQRENSTR